MELQIHQFLAELEREFVSFFESDREREECAEDGFRGGFWGGEEYLIQNNTLLKPAPPPPFLSISAF